MDFFCYTVDCSISKFTDRKEIVILISPNASSDRNGFFDEVSQETAFLNQYL